MIRYILNLAYVSAALASDRPRVAVPDHLNSYNSSDDELFKHGHNRNQSKIKISYHTAFYGLGLICWLPQQHHTFGLTVVRHLYHNCIRNPWDISSHFVNTVSPVDTPNTLSSVLERLMWQLHTPLLRV